jgi:hypothetical protein
MHNNKGTTFSVFFSLFILANMLSWHTMGRQQGQSEVVLLPRQPDLVLGHDLVVKYGPPHKTVLSMSKYNKIFYVLSMSKYNKIFYVLSMSKYNKIVYVYS